MRDGAQLWIKCKWQHRRNEIDLLLGKHGAHGRKRRLYDGVVAVRLEAMLPQHRPHGDVNSAACGVGRDDLAFKILDFLDRAIVEDFVSVVAVAWCTILKFVGDDPDIVHAGIFDRYRQGGKGEVADLYFV